MDAITYIGGGIASGILGMSFHSGRGPFRIAQGDASLIFHPVEGGILKKIFSEKETKSRRVSSKEPINGSLHQ